MDFRHPTDTAETVAIIQALLIRIGFRGILYYSYNTEPPTIVLITIETLIVAAELLHLEASL